MSDDRTELIEFISASTHQAHALMNPNRSSLSTHRAANYKLYDTCLTFLNVCLVLFIIGDINFYRPSRQLRSSTNNTGLQNYIRNNFSSCLAVNSHFVSSLVLANIQLLLPGINIHMNTFLRKCPSDQSVQVFFVHPCSELI